MTQVKYSDAYVKRVVGLKVCSLVTHMTSRAVRPISLTRPVELGREASRPTRCWKLSTRGPCSVSRGELSCLVMGYTPGCCWGRAVRAFGDERREGGRGYQIGGGEEGRRLLGCGRERWRCALGEIR